MGMQRRAIGVIVNAAKGEIVECHRNIDWRGDQAILTKCRKMPDRQNGKREQRGNRKRLEPLKINGRGLRVRGCHDG